MRRFRLPYIPVLAVACLVTALVGAARADLEFTLSNIATSSAAVITTNDWEEPISGTDYRVNGDVDAVYVDLSGYASPTCDVLIATYSGGPLLIPQTIITLDDVTADGVYPVTDLKCTTAGSDTTAETIPIMLKGDTVYMTCSDANSTGITINAVVKIK